LVAPVVFFSAIVPAPNRRAALPRYASRLASAGGATSAGSAARTTTSAATVAALATRATITTASTSTALTAPVTGALAATVLARLTLDRHRGSRSGRLGDLRRALRTEEIRNRLAAPGGLCFEALEV